MFYVPIRHSRESGNPSVRRAILDSRFRGNDERGLAKDDLKNEPNLSQRTVLQCVMRIYPCRLTEEAHETT
jgi:hypothetical protein